MFGMAYGAGKCLLALMVGQKPGLGVFEKGSLIMIRATL